MATIGTLWVHLKCNASNLNNTLTSANRKVDTWAKKTSKSLNEVNNAPFAKLQSSLLGLKTLFTAGILGTAVTDIIRTGIEFEKLEFRIIAATGSVKGAAGELAFVRAESDRLGLRLKDAATMFGTIAASAKGTSIQGQHVRDVFTAISEAGTVLRLSSEEVNGALYAVSQMISKGVVSMEELRQQLGERLPGALLIAQRALGKNGVEFDKMISSGKVLTEDFLPKFAAELRRTFQDGIPDAIKSTQSEMNRFLTEWDDALNQMANSGLIEGFRWLMKGALATYKGVNFATTVFTAELIGLYERAVYEIKAIWNGLRGVVLHSWNGILTIAHNGVVKLGEFVDWFYKKLGMSSGIVGKAYDSLADGIKAGITEDPGVQEYFDNISKEYAERMNALDDLKYERWKALFDPQHIVPPPIDPGPKYPPAKDQAAETAAKKRAEEMAKVLRELQTDVGRFNFTDFEKEMYELGVRMEDLKSKYPELSKEIKAWYDDMAKGVSNKEAERLAEDHAERMKALSEARLAQTEGNINAQLAEMDLAEKLHTMSRGELAEGRTKAYESLLEAQEKYLKGLDKSADPSSWYSQINAINNTRTALVELQIEQRKIIGTQEEGIAEGFRSFVDGARTSFEMGEVLATDTASAMQNTFEKGFFSVMQGRFEDLKTLLADFTNAVMQSMAKIMAEKTAVSLMGGSSGSGGIMGLFSSFLGTATNSSFASNSGAMVSDFMGSGNQIGLGVVSQARSYYKGGIIDEHIIGRGQRSGELYQFGENGPETVTPGLDGGRKVVENTSRQDDNEKSTNNNFYIYAVDPQSFHDICKRNPGAIVSQVTAALASGDKGLRNSLNYGR